MKKFALVLAFFVCAPLALVARLPNDGESLIEFLGCFHRGRAGLRKTVREWLDDQRTRIVLNLADVNYIDSSGIGELVSAFTAVKNRGGEMKLLHLTKKVHDLLQLTKLFTVFDVYSDEPTAIGSFR